MRKENLRTLLHGSLTCGPLQPADAVRHWIQLLTGLDVLHALGVLHSNIKPENILLRSKGGRLVLADYGFSRIRDCFFRLPGSAVHPDIVVARLAADLITA